MNRATFVVRRVAPRPVGEVAVGEARERPAVAPDAAALERVIVAALVLLSACRLCALRSWLQLLVALPHWSRIGVLGISPASCWRVAQEL